MPPTAAVDSATDYGDNSAAADGHTPPPPQTAPNPRALCVLGARPPAAAAARWHADAAGVVPLEPTGGTAAAPDYYFECYGGSRRPATSARLLNGNTTRGVLPPPQ